ncbi:MAG: 16S rRNA (cytosine(1402)-N(4))-methyltransferase RsmH [Bacteroidales bacterium]|jgi:16S rRNA (cytosine1402-N4)-methyltransferase|nr:16S rRNA (cytosine(1402)-N(4))-methyltransferase RsmH [Bacteroidales bacterium]MDY0252876.1 16S rRNA (cytosine(1402)-N(4))-methyltransferase RsmH [Tenuifilaceae bacterium]
MAYHIPVLLHESIEGLNIAPDGTYLDLTFGGGGHSREILKHLSAKGRLIAFDQDEEAFANTIDDSRFMLIRSNFRYFRNFLRYHKIHKVDGILADLGVSSKHFDSPDRGFSFRFEGPLDMRMNRNAPLTAEVVVNTYNEKVLAKILSLYGELTNANRLAKAIANEREHSPITTVEQLADLVSPMFPPQQKNKMLAKVFQAIRIEVNREMETLRQMLLQVGQTLTTEGRLVVIAYHSLEDRLVKNYIRSGNFEGEVEKDFYGNVISTFEQLNRKVIVPSEEEILRNPRSRSAKLRIARKK